MSIVQTQRYSALPVDELPIMDLVYNAAMAVKGDEALKLWSKHYYGRAVSLFSGSDQDNPPGEDSYPMIEVVPMDSNVGREIERHERIIGIAFGLHDPEKKPVFYKDMSVQQGVLRLEEFLSFILQAVSGADLLGGYVSEIVTARDMKTLFPFFLGGSEITIVKPT